MKKFKDLTGFKFNMLTVEKLSESTSKDRRWDCRCDCGKLFSLSRTRIGKQISCGCRDYRTKQYPIKKCANPDCQNSFQVVSKDLNKKYCTKKCANSYIGKNSKLGEFNKGKTPPEGSGRCKWYTFDSKFCGKIRVQGTWELRFANCLEAYNESWRTNHNKDRFSYKDENGNEKTYSPDFYCDGTYYEVKGYLDKSTAYKMQKIAEQGINVKIINWKDLVDLESILFGKQLCAQNTTKAVISSLEAN